MRARSPARDSGSRSRAALAVRPDSSAVRATVHHVRRAHAPERVDPAMHADYLLHFVGPIEAQDDVRELHELIEKHHRYTGSTPAGWILEHWHVALSQFVKVMPTDYKRVLMAREARAEPAAASVESA